MTVGAIEVNFDALAGPTHHYAGLSYGNLASLTHAGRTSNPKAAARQGLAKMKFLADLSAAQAVLPPQERPDMALLRRLGFSGNDPEVLRRAHREAPLLLAAACSASSMWAANAATVSPSPDTADGRLHLTPANLLTHLHRSIEPPTTTALLRAIFADDSQFVVHDPLPAAPLLGDEGAANHTRLCRRHGEAGLELFVFGGEGGAFPRRQSRHASAAVARLHDLDPDRTLFLEQHPAAIDQGVFHNDVIAVGNENVWFYHEKAFANGAAVVDQARFAFAKAGCGELRLIPVTEAQLSVPEAVASYLFNSQLLTMPDGSMSLVCPLECRDHPQARAVLAQVLSDPTPVNAVHYVDIRQSMRNGGGPACLRLRVVLTDPQLSAMLQGVRFTDLLYRRLTNWVERHYRESLHPDDLADPHLLRESRAALDELTGILQLGSIYHFQR